MAEFSIQQKINSYLASHPTMKGKSEEIILSAMQKEGIVTQAEIDFAKKTSAFGFGFNKDYGTGISFEKVSEKEPVQVPFKSPEELEQIRLETEKQQIFEAKRNEVVNHIQQRAVSSQLRTTVQELAKQYKLEGEELNEYVEFFFGDTLPKDWQKFANKNEPLYESGLKIKMGNNEKSIEDFLVKDLDIDILSNKGVNTYANFLFMEQEELDKVDFNNLDKVVKSFGMD